MSSPTATTPVMPADVSAASSTALGSRTTTRSRGLNADQYAEEMRVQLASALARV